MSFKKIDRSEVLLIRYCQETISDMEVLNRALQAEAASGKARDTILELPGATVIYSTEIGIIVQFLKTLPGTGRTLRLVASNYVCEMLKTMNIHRIPNIVLYNTLDEVQECFKGVDFDVDF
jgi:anti-anti-sigma regulatory factor